VLISACYVVFIVVPGPYRHVVVVPLPSCPKAGRPALFRRYPDDAYIFFNSGVLRSM